MGALAADERARLLDLLDPAGDQPAVVPDPLRRAAPLALPALKRLFVARRAGAAEAVLACAQLPATGAWYFEDLVRVPDAVNGATELLVTTALERLRDEGAPSAAFALAPMRGMRDQIDTRARWLGWVLEG